MEIIWALVVVFIIAWAFTSNNEKGENWFEEIVFGISRTILKAIQILTVTIVTVIVTIVTLIFRPMAFGLNAKKTSTEKEDLLRFKKSFNKE